MCRAQIIGLAAEIDTVLRYWLQGVTASISRHGTAEDTMVIFKRLVEKWQVGENKKKSAKSYFRKIYTVSSKAQDISKDLLRATLYKENS